MRGRMRCRLDVARDTNAFQTTSMTSATSGLDALLVFIPVFAVAAASPGPTIAAIVARVVGRGLRGIGFFIAGLVIGDLVWLTLAIFGLAALAATFHLAFAAVKWGGAAYLAWLAYKLWTAPARAPESIDADTPRGDGPALLAGGLAVSLGNPKTMVFYLALLPNVVDLAHVTTPTYLEFAGVIALLLPLILGAYALMAVRARRMLRNARAMRLVNRGVGAMMAGAAAVIATR